MKNQNQFSPEIQKLLREKGSLCVTMIIPAEPVRAQRAKDRLLAEKNREQAFLALDDYARRQKIDGTDKLKKKIDALLAQIDYSKAKQGIGIYVSPKTALFRYFDFPVRQRMTAGASFLVRELLQDEQMKREYYTLMLSSHQAHLYRCSGEEFTEVTTNGFPGKFSDTYEYARPARGSSVGYAMKNPEGDKSKKSKQRTETFFRATDTALDAVLAKDARLVVAGVKADVALFLSVTKHKKSVAGTVNGNFEHGAIRKLEQAAAKLIRKSLDKERAAELKRLENSADGLFVMGLRDCWSEAYEGKALELFVERDYSRGAFSGDQPGKITLRKSPAKKSTLISDAVDDLVEMVIAKNGRVFLFESGELEHLDGVAILKRY